jgi:hypothetical protein
LRPSREAPHRGFDDEAAGPTHVVDTCRWSPAVGRRVLIHMDIEDLWWSERATHGPRAALAGDYSVVQPA